LPGVSEVKANFNEGAAVVAYDGDATDLEQIKRAIRDLNYTPREGGENKAAPKPSPILNLLGVLLVLFGAFFLLNQFGVFNLFNFFPTPVAGANGTSLLMLFVIGLLTSVHCVAMCGGINISQTAARKENPAGQAAQAGTDAQIIQTTDREAIQAGTAEQTIQTETAEQAIQAETAEQITPTAAAPAKPKLNLTTFRSSLLYNAGRVVSYTAVGFIVGALGSVLTFSDIGRGIVSMVAGVFMILMGLNMLNLFPWLRYITPRMPKFLAKRIDAQKAKSKSPLIVGLLNGLMPCGPLQTMQIYALSTGSPFLGALSMFLFALGTVPLMFAVGALSSILTRKFAKKLMAASAALVVLMGMFMFTNGTALSGVAMPEFLGGTGVVVASEIDRANNVQTVEFDLQSRGYGSVKVTKGIPVVWTIHADAGNLNSCNGELRIGKYGISKKLEVGDNVIEFTPDAVGTVQYSCWMGMIKGKIIVV
jgi:sulfite exporter TauE/SafE